MNFLKSALSGSMADRRQDLFASISVFLVSLPITIGIAIASNVTPAAAILSAIFGTLFFGLFSSSEVAIYGPAAGLAVFLASAASDASNVASLAGATAIAGILLIFLARIRAYQVIDLIPMSVIKGMACGIGLTLVFKMFPHLLGTNDEWLRGWIGLGADTTGDSSDPLPAKEGNSVSATAIFISAVCLGLAWVGHLTQTNRTKAHSTIDVESDVVPIRRPFPYAFVVILVGAVLSYLIGRFLPDFALNDSQMLHLNISDLHFELHGLDGVDLWPTLRLGAIITAVILLEGTINLRLIQKLDPTRRRVNPRREFFLTGFANILLSFFGALPVMPILIRSTANLEFGARSRLSSILQAFWLLLAVTVAHVFEFVPIAAVASLLVLVGLNLVDIGVIRELYRRGRSQFAPFAITVLMILAVDLLWGIFCGLAIGLFYSVRSSLSRTMILVEDGEDYLLKFFKDVTFIHKSELKNNLYAIPEGRNVIIDGTGNIVIDSEIEDWLTEYARESAMQGRTVKFTRSRLAISKLFKEVPNA